MSKMGFNVVFQRLIALQVGIR